MNEQYIIRNTHSHGNVFPKKLLEIPVNFRFCRVCGQPFKRIKLKEFSQETGEAVLHPTNHLVCGNWHGYWHKVVIPHTHLCDCGRQTNKMGCHGFFCNSRSCGERCIICGFDFCNAGGGFGML